ncbi:hypothetical protein J2W28_001000 [Variovorax boronicumulans]|uniref:head-tail connector protein n=1 Tax=Variovorax boronicumulans TaxID=436515 RepID=UPI00277EE908|nr:head-tail connector protein [Variovorax boronicumulans]MDP9991972.1 hypothetical protein [Variovorax boronicumulans]MDQ0001867.1 hypothetical protein [Variovorax boronicumulans]
MIELVTMEEAQAHLKITNPDVDLLDLQLKINAASKVVLNYLAGTNFYEVEVDINNVPILDTSGEPIYAETSSGDRIVMYEVKAATLLMLGYLNRDRDTDEEKAFEMGFIPRPVTALLYPLRTPTIA